MRRSLGPIIAAAAAYVLLTTALTWPLILHPGRVVPNDTGDPLLNTWILAWNARIAPVTTAWWNAPQFYPAPDTMAFSEHLLGLTLFTTPVIQLTGNPLLAYNTAFFLSFVLSGLSAYFLVFTIARRHDCAFLAGLAFAFAPYRMAQLAHVQVLSSYWMPLALASLHRYVASDRLRWAALFAVAWLMQALACGYYLFYLSVLVVVWLAWFVSPPRSWRSVMRLAIPWSIAALLLVPILYGYWRVQHAYGLRRGITEIVQFSADVASLLKAPDTLRLWGWLDAVDHPESQLFPGLTVAVLIIAGLAVGWRSAERVMSGRRRTVRVMIALAGILLAVAASPLIFGTWRLEIGGARLLSVGAPHKPLSIALLLFVVAGAMHPAVRTAWTRRSPLAFYTLAAALMWLFSLGPAPTLFDRPFLYKAPYAWLMLLPGVDGIRVPARFWMLATLCLSVAAALALRQIASRWPRAANAVTAAACVGVLADGWPLPVRLEPAPSARPAHTRAVARLDLPATPWHDTIALYRATEHGRPLLNGYSGYFAPHYWPLQYLVTQHDPAVLTRMSSLGPLEVVIDKGLDAGGELQKFVAGHPQASLVFEDADYASFRIERGRHVGLLPDIAGEPLRIASISSDVGSPLLPNMLDGNIVSRWSTGREQRRGDHFAVDLGAVHTVHGVRMLIGGFTTDFPRMMSIETSLDGGTWSPGWSGATGLLALSAALEDPLDVSMPFVLEPRNARYVRFTERKSDEKYYWSVAELSILGR